MPLPKHQRAVITLSIHILRTGVGRSSDGRVDGIEIRLALRCLLPHCPERWPLELDWDAVKQDNEIGRAQGVTATFNGIVRQLRRAGRYEELPRRSGQAVILVPAYDADPGVRPDALRLPPQRITAEVGVQMQKAPCALSWVGAEGVTSPARNAYTIAP